MRNLTPEEERRIESAALKQHDANLKRGGVFNRDGTRFSDINVERKVARSRLIAELATTKIMVNPQSHES